MVILLEVSLLAFRKSLPHKRFGLEARVGIELNFVAKSMGFKTTPQTSCLYRLNFNYTPYCTPRVKNGPKLSKQGQNEFLVLLARPLIYCGSTKSGPSRHQPPPKMTEHGKANRTCNLALVVLRNVLNRAKQDGFINTTSGRNLLDVHGEKAHYLKTSSARRS
jgi:hypothetical protein